MGMTRVCSRLDRQMARSTEEIESEAICALIENDPKQMRSLAAELEALGREETATAMRSQASELENRGA